MTVQAGIEVDVDLAELVGEMPEVPCEHGAHHEDPEWHDNGAATHYLHGSCECGRDKVFAACQAFVNHVIADFEMRCNQCQAERPAKDFITILGPVKA